MIVPTTILSLAALSAAESNSSRNRGLRKSSTPWTAIAVVSGTAITGVVIGGLIGWFVKGSGGGSCPTGYDCEQITQCSKGAWLSAVPAAATADAAKVDAVCTPCKGNTQVTGDAHKFDRGSVGTAADCNQCVNDAYPNADKTCELCPKERLPVTSANAAVLTSNFLTKDTACAAVQEAR